MGSVCCWPWPWRCRRSVNRRIRRRRLRRAKKALKKAKKANKKAEQALSVANEALATANQALGQGGQLGAPAAPGAPGAPGAAANVSAGQVVSVRVEGSPPDTGFRLIDVSDGFAWGLSCTSENGEPTSSLVVANLTPGQDPAGNGGGGDSHIDGGLQFTAPNGDPTGDQSNSFDMGESAVVATSFNPAQDAAATPPVSPPATSSRGLGSRTGSPGRLRMTFPPSSAAPTWGRSTGDSLTWPSS